MPAREGLFALSLSKVCSIAISLLENFGSVSNSSILSSRESLIRSLSQSIVWTPYRHAAESDNNLLATDHTMIILFIERFDLLMNRH